MTEDLLLLRNPRGPTHAGLSVTTRCNLSCRMCQRSRFSPQVSCDISVERFSKVLNDLPSSVSSVNLSSGLGEPLLHPSLPMLVQLCREANLRTICFTNGTCLDAEVAKRLFGSGLDLLLISVDSLDATEYSRIRVGGVLGDTIAGAMHAVSAARDFRGCEVRLTKVVSPNETERSLRQFLRRAATIGTHGVEFRLQQHEGMKSQDYLREAERLSGLGLEKCISQPVYLPKVRTSGHLCSDLWTAIHFNTRGAVRQCCMDFSQERPAQHSALAAWMTDTLGVFATAQSAESRSPSCETCVFSVVGGVAE